MSHLFKNTYRVAPARLKTWNYAFPANYFITICTKNRQNYFGEIIGTVETRGIASRETPTGLDSNVETRGIASNETTDAFSNVKTRGIASNETTDAFSNVETRGIASLQATEIGKIAEIEWHRTMELRSDMNLELGPFVVMPNHIHGIIDIGDNIYNSKIGYEASKFGPQTNNIASIIRGYKSAVTIYARKNNIEFDWQTRFYDHIIRSENEYLNITKYIHSNPEKSFKQICSSALSPEPGISFQCPATDE